MFTKNYKKKDIPKDSYVIRIANTKNYIHIYEDSNLYVKSKMNGCMVFLSKETANEMVELLKRIEMEVVDFISYDELTKYEAITFEKAYQEHGLIERQAIYN